MYEPPKVWMGAAVPADIRKTWIEAPAHYWRRGVLDSLRNTASHIYGDEVLRWAEQEIEDRARRAEERKR